MVQWQQAESSVLETIVGSPAREPRKHPNIKPPSQLQPALHMYPLCADLTLCLVPLRFILRSLNADKSRRARS